MGSRRRQRDREPFSWDSVDVSELASADGVDDLRRALTRFEKSHDAAHGAGAGDVVRCGAFNVAKRYADLLGADKPDTVGQWRRGMGIVGPDGEKM